MFNTGDVIFQIFMFAFVLFLVVGGFLVVKAAASQSKRSKRLEEKMDQILEQRNER